MKMALFVRSDGYDAAQTSERALFHATGWWMSAYMPPLLDKEPSDCDTRHCFTKRAHAAIAARRSCRYNESSFAFFSFSFPSLFSPLLFPSLHLSSPNAVLLLPLIAKTDPTRGLQPRKSPCGIYYEAVAPLRNMQMFEQEKFHYKYFKCIT